MLEADAAELLFELSVFQLGFLSFGFFFEEHFFPSLVV